MDMENFIYSVPTKIYFGRGQISRLGEAVSACGSRALLVYGGGSIKKSGLYDTVIGILGKSSVSVTELSGVEPNPRIGSVRKGVELCRKNGIDVVLAVGGGSAIDCAKVIAAGARYEGDAWDLVKEPEKIGEVLPIVSVLTLSATGSEMDANAVITNPETNEKLGTSSESMRPKASILDPEYTFTVSGKQTAAGTADIMSHILESYFNNTKGAYIQARFAESLLKTCIRYGRIAVEKPDDYEARANLMWASSLAINGLLPAGDGVAWSVHPMEHELSAFYDITHGVGLAILTPNWMEYVLSDKTAAKFAEYGENVWGLAHEDDPRQTAREAIRKTRDYFHSLGIPSTLQEVGIGEEKLEIMARRAAEKGLEYGFVPLGADDVLKIYRASL